MLVVFLKRAQYKKEIKGQGKIMCVWVGTASCKYTMSTSKVRLISNATRLTDIMRSLISVRRAGTTLILEVWIDASITHF